MQLYLRELVRALDKEDENWRRHTVILFDGAKYHQSVSTFNVLRQLRIPTMLLFPHSYNVAPVELLFGAIKSKHLNVHEQPTGRR